MSKFYKEVADPSTEIDKIAAFHEITLPQNKVDRYMRRQLVKEGSVGSYIVPTTLGLGAAGTAAYIATNDATNKAKLKAYKKIKDRDKRKQAETEIESRRYTGAGAAGLGAGLGAMYLTGSHAADDAVREAGSIGKMTTKQKLLHAPGTGFQKLLRKGGASSAQGKGIAGALVLGGGALAGKVMGDKMGDQAIANATGMPKSAGLFLKPSDLASHHHGLSEALEGRLNSGDDSKTFKKQATMDPKLRGAVAGAVVGGAYEPLRQKLTQPLKDPGPEQPKGLSGRLKKSISRARYKADAQRREHPVTSAITGAVIGAGVGASTKFTSGLVELNKTRKGLT